MCDLRVILTLFLSSSFPPQGTGSWRELGQGSGQQKHSVDQSAVLPSPEAGPQGTWQGQPGPLLLPGPGPLPAHLIALRASPPLSSVRRGRAEGRPGWQAGVPGSPTLWVEISILPSLLKAFIMSELSREVASISARAGLEEGLASFSPCWGDWAGPSSHNPGCWQPRVTDDVDRHPSLQIAK